MEKIEISEIKPYSKNAKKHPQKQIKLIAESIRRFGFDSPIIIDKNNEIIAGHGRFEAAKLLGLTEVPIILKENLTDDEVKAYRLADNKLAESEWDMGLAIEELKGLSDDDLFGLTGFDRNLLLDVDEDDFDAEAEYRKIKKARVKKGDLYELGKHKLLCGDSTKKESYGRLLEKGVSADLVFTDPPYNVNYDYTITYVKGRVRKNKLRTFSDNKTDENFIKFIADVFKNCFDFSKEGSCFYCWHASKTEYLFRLGIEKAGYYVSQTLHWIKNGCTFSKGLDYLYANEPCYFGWKKGKRHFNNKKVVRDFKNMIALDINEFSELPNIWYENRDKISDYGHPTQKPVRLAERALKKHSDINDIVLEPFCGSGSTLIACEQLKRKCYAIELDPIYCEVIINRWLKFKGGDEIIRNGEKTRWK